MREVKRRPRSDLLGEVSFLVELPMSAVVIVPGAYPATWIPEPVLPRKFERTTEALAPLLR